MLLPQLVRLRSSFGEDSVFSACSWRVWAVGVEYMVVGDVAVVEVAAAVAEVAAGVAAGVAVGVVVGAVAVAVTVEGEKAVAAAVAVK